MKHAAAKLEGLGVAHEIVGTFFDRGFEPGGPGAIVHPLNLTIHIRATNPDPLAMDVRLSSSVSYKAAVEVGNESCPRRGELLLWQDGVSSASNGGTRRQEQAVVKVATQRLDEFLAIIATSWPK